jgi:hypothetical protein
VCFDSARARTVRPVRSSDLAIGPQISRCCCRAYSDRSRNTLDLMRTQSKGKPSLSRR